MKPGSIIQLKFLDHAEYDGMPDGAVEIEVIGRLLGVTEHTYEVGVWMAQDVGFSGSNTSFSILKKTVIKKTLLKSK